jgi:CYTH domain-containing protein
MSFLIALLLVAAQQQIANGVTRIRLAADSPAMAVKGHRENGNAHSFEVVNFYIQVDGEWNLVPLFGKKMEKERYELTISGGADCVLHDFRLLQPAAGKSARLVLAEREFGETFADTMPVTFTFYELKERGDDPLGPNYWFEAVSTKKSAQPFCDVGEAFKRELNL